MKTNKALKNILNVIFNVFWGLICFWDFAYALLFITDRKDAEAESFVSLGYFMFVTGILVFIVPQIVILVKRENKKEYLIFNILPMAVTLIVMILWAIKIEMGYY